MAKYIETANKARVQVEKILAMVPEEQRPAIAAELAHLFNLGFRCNPRAAMATIRFTAIRTAFKTAPVTIQQKTVPIFPGASKTFAALVVIPNGQTAEVAEVANADDEE